MADLSKVGMTAMSLIDHLENVLEDGEVVGEIMLLVQVKTEEGTERIQTCCSTDSYVVQRGMVAWANDCMVDDAVFLTEEEDSE